MTPTELRDAILHAVDEYAASCMALGAAAAVDDSIREARASQTARRRYATVQRLTNDLAERAA